MPRPNNAGAGGFTLLEMLVVLLIVGATSAIVIPRLTTVASSFEFALKREAFEQVLNGLSYQAFRDDQEIVLSGEYTDQGRLAGSDAAAPGETIDAGLRARSAVAQDRELLPPVNPLYFAPALPEGWRMVVDDPIYFHGSGYCTGGKVDVEIGKALYSYVLAAPLCHATLAE